MQFPSKLYEIKVSAFIYGQPLFYKSMCSKWRFLLANSKETLLPRFDGDLPYFIFPRRILKLNL